MIRWFTEQDGIVSFSFTPSEFPRCSRHFSRRRFLKACSGGAALGATWNLEGNDEKNASAIIETDAADGDALQAELDRNAGQNVIVRIKSSRDIVCLVREQLIDGEKSAHPLLVPPGVELDLQGARLQLDLRTNSYGVRLSDGASIRNGEIQIVRSEGKGLQACWHSGISIGAAYGDGGTPEKPGRFSTVRNWLVENITIDQPFAAAGIQLMSEACHGIIRGVRILDSPHALLGIGMDWGTVGPITSEDAQASRMREMLEAGKIYSTHPHHVLVEKLSVGRLTRNMDANDAGVRCSACHSITIRDVQVEEAAAAVAIFGGDCGYEFARADQRQFQHTDYRIEDVRINRALIMGLVLNGSADNIYRASRQHGYRPVRDPVHPGLVRPLIRNLTLRGGGDRSNRQGIYAVAVSNAELENVTIENFDIGVHAEDWVRGMQFRNTRFAGNRRDQLIEGATEPAVDVQFD